MWRKGKEHAILDALSRAPINDPGPDDEAANSNVTAFAYRTIISRIAAISYDDNLDPDESAAPPHLPDPLVDEIRAVAASDGEYSALIAAIESGFPKRRDRAPPPQWEIIGASATNYQWNKVLCCSETEL